MPMQLAELMLKVVAGGEYDISYLLQLDLYDDNNIDYSYSILRTLPSFAKNKNRGRGVIQTSGVCNFGKLNYFLGAGAANDGRSSRYPQIDFCKYDYVCSFVN